ncbi:MAG: hypothetical protein OXG37_14855 [Actinomycetia bacterium]|nr:hypothetical protein [Actinomycetes bacterium]
MSRRRCMQRNIGLGVALAVAALALLGGILAACAGSQEGGQGSDGAQPAEGGQPAEPEPAGAAAGREPASERAGQASTEALPAAEAPEPAAPEPTGVLPQEPPSAPVDSASESAPELDAKTERLIAGSGAHIEENRRLALLLAAEAYGREASVETVAALERALAGAPDFLGYLGSGSNTYEDLVFSEAADHLVAVSGRFLEGFHLASGTLSARTVIQDSSAPGSLSADGGWAVVVLDPTTAVLYRTRDGQLLSTVKTGETVSAALTAAAAASGGDRIATGHEDGTMVVWDTASREPVTEVASHAGPIGLLRFSPDGSILAVATTSGLETAEEPERLVRLWEASTGEPLGAGLDPNGGLDRPSAARAVSFGRDGQTISIAAQGSIHTFDLATLEVTMTVRLPAPIGEGERLRGFAILDDSTLAVGLSDGTALVLDTGEGSSTALEPQMGDLCAVAGSPDGSRLALAGEQGIAIYSLDGTQLLPAASSATELDPDELHDLACKAAGRNMTRAEWDEWGPTDTNYRSTCGQFPIQSASRS